MVVGDVCHYKEGILGSSVWFALTLSNALALRVAVSRWGLSLPVSLDDHSQ